jgi:hypothetical protein
MPTDKIKDRYMTLRLPADVERDLRKMAEADTRTLAAQILHCIKLEMARQQALEAKARDNSITKTVCR